MIQKRVRVPTGDILVVRGEHEGGLLECLSLADYGKEKNVKADFLGLAREIEGVPHGDLLPLSEKWVCTISSQYGCAMGCRFCDAPKIGVRGNASGEDLMRQVRAVLSLHPEVHETKRFNVHFARIGEPALNPEVPAAAYEMAVMLPAGFRFHPVMSTLWPQGWEWNIERWVRLKNDLDGNAGLQISVNSTSRQWRGWAMPAAADLEHVSRELAQIINRTGLKGRKVALNFALTPAAAIDVRYLRRLFDPTACMVKLTPMHETHACAANEIHTPDGYATFHPYREAEAALKAEGFDVIVFVPSREEDESRITCGNAIIAQEAP